MTGVRPETLSAEIKKMARDLGFDLCGIAEVHTLTEHEKHLEDWCSAGMNGSMNYLCSSIPKRTDPALTFPGSRSVIVTGLNYYSGQKQGGGGVPVISRYAYGENYHDVIRKKLNIILDHIIASEPSAKGRSFVDSAPILEKAWAREAGLGWPGRNSVVINKNIGSFFFIGVILTDIVLEYDNPVTEDYCGDCRKCIEGCPSGAINENRTIDARKCISYHTIESDDIVPDEIRTKLEGRIFGCDKCQEVCPWNHKAKDHTTPEFVISLEIASMTREEWLTITPDRFSELFRRSAIRRGGYSRLKRNLVAAFPK